MTSQTHTTWTVTRWERTGVQLHSAAATILVYSAGGGWVLAVVAHTGGIDDGAWTYETRREALEWALQSRREINFPD